MPNAQFKAEYYSGKDNASAVYLVDANGNLYAAGGGSATSVAINDGVSSSLKATVGPFHNSDNQAASGIANALFSAGIAQILNPAGTIDRQRGTGTDGIAAVGIATGTQQLAGPTLTTTFNGAVTGNAVAQTITVASTANLKAGGGDIITTSDNVESAEIITVLSGTTFTAILKNNHANLATLSWYHYNQARDASIGDQVALTGMSPSQTYLYNNVTQLAEIERSAAGELDGGKGIGFNAAIGQEYNGGGPALASGLLSAMNYDRERNLQGKTLQTATLTATTATDTVLKFASAAATNTVQPGAPVLLAAGSVSVLANQKEIAYVSASWVPGSAANVPIQSPVVNSGSTTAAWEIYATNGPGITGFTAIGVGIEEEALYDPVTGLFYIERAATQDGVVPQNVVLENVALWNGATMDRLKGDATGAARVSLYGKNAAAGDTAIKLDGTGNVQASITNFPSNQDGLTAVASGTFTTNQTSGNQSNFNQRGCNFFVKTGAFGTGASGIVVTVQGIDPASGNTTWTILQSAALSASAFQVLTVYPGVAAAANVAANAVMPRTWNVTITATSWGTGGSAVGVTYGQIL